MGHHIEELQKEREALNVGDKIPQEVENAIWLKMFACEEYVNVQLETKTRTAKEIKWKLMKAVVGFNLNLLAKE